MLSLIACFALGAGPFTVENKMPTFVVVNTKSVTRTVVTYRDPVGHTHTCVNGHTWDHQITPGHNCPQCGAYQNVQDRTPRKVTVIRTVAVNASAPSPTPASPAPQRTVQSPVFYFPATRANCPNGNCPYVR